jgi:hypothetical protein
VKFLLILTRSIILFTIAYAIEIVGKALLKTSRAIEDYEVRINPLL